MFALRKLRRYEEVLHVNESLPFKTPRSWRWDVLYRSNQKEKVLEEVGDYTDIGLFRMAQQYGDTSTMGLFYRNYCLQLKKSDAVRKDPFSAFYLAVMEFRMGKIDEAEKALKQTSTLRDQQRQQHMLGLLYAATGRKEKATEVIDYLLLHENEFDHGVTRYYVAKIEAELNDKAKSVDFLRQAVAKGFEFRPSLFEFDGDLGNMLNYQPFIELVTPKE
jgi:tetratricopeptide (TPR) repeat protein